MIRRDGHSKLAPGAQRLSMDALHRFESLQYGMFLHFGMSTFVENELPSGADPSTTYSPDKLDVDQWICVARDAGMRYAVLVTKHVSGHCLWPSELTDYSVASSGNKTDVVDAFLRSCERHGIVPGLYYCSWDNRHRFGSITPSDVPLDRASTTPKYCEFQMGHIKELVDRYGRVPIYWIDVPGVLGVAGRKAQYDQLASLAPDSIVMLNQGFGDGSEIKMDYAWPSDLVAIERWLPASNRGYKPWHRVSENGAVRDYYLPGEVSDPIGYEWFRVSDDPPRSDAELLGMWLICRERGVNFLLDVPPDKHGLIPQEHVDALMRLAKNCERMGLSCRAN